MSKKKSKQRVMRAGSFSQKVQNELSVISASFSLKRKIIKTSLILSCGEGIYFKFGGIFVNVLFLKVSNLIYSHVGKRKKQQQQKNLNMKCLPKKPWPCGHLGSIFFLTQVRFYICYDFLNLLCSNGYVRQKQ